VAISWRTNSRYRAASGGDAEVFTDFCGCGFSAFAAGSGSADTRFFRFAALIFTILAVFAAFSAMYFFVSAKSRAGLEALCADFGVLRAASDLSAARAEAESSANSAVRMRVVSNVFMFS
jgi:hypothetical protein